MDNDIKLLIKNVKKDKNDFESWDKLYLMYKGFLMNIIGKYIFESDLRQDLLQEIWIKVFKNIKSYDEARYFEAWLHVVARNVCFTWLKSNSEKIENANDTKENTSGNLESAQIYFQKVCYDESYEEGIEQSYNQRDFVENLCNREIIKQALSGIKDKKYVLAFKYKFIDGLTLQQIAKIFSTPENVVKNWIYREVVYKIRPILQDQLKQNSKKRSSYNNDE